MPRKTIRKNLSYDSERRLYYVIFHSGSDGHGHRRRHTKTYRTFQEAVAAQVNGEAVRSGYVERNRLPKPGCTLEVWLLYWLDEIIARDRAAATVYGYRNVVRNHVLPALGHLRLPQLSAARLQMYLHQRMDEGLSPNTVLKHHILLGSCLRAAVRLELLERNPMERVDPPKRMAPQYTFYTPEQIRRLFSVTYGTEMELPVKLAAYLGLRRSEICGLRWGCVDMQAGVITIREVRTQVGGVPVTKAPKTASSQRKLGIGGLRDLQDALLRAWQKRRDYDDLRELVLQDERGVSPEADQLSANLAEIVRRNDLPKITMHGLRHSFASLANRQGVNMFDISKTLGHSSMSITSAIYTHLFDETEEAVVSTVAQAIEDGRQARPLQA